MIEVRNLNKSIKNKTILNNINLSFKNKVTYAILGQNGAGKTTFIKTLFNEYKINSGKITLNGKEISKEEYKNMYFFTENNELPIDLKVSEYLKYYLGISGFRKNINDYILKLEWLFDYKKYKNTLIKKLSAGEKKKLTLFIMLILDPEIIFFDEPTANLDEKNKVILFKIFSLLKEKNKTLIIISHLIDEIKTFIDHVVIFKEGQIVYNHELKKEDDIKKIYHKYIFDEEDENKKSMDKDIELKMKGIFKNEN
ncbi:ABC transporter ATP-binding protein [Spiroplasma endosymbiont of Diplazon laetatorius]|uniref:ABC transporter ATP-binding protein n=1 Tax=Spiroplasma endosymbiont of Diplazon laetatorius TaxID=3066322 RepID=UPI0030D47EFB